MSSILESKLVNLALFLRGGQAPQSCQMGRLILFREEIEPEIDSLVSLSQNEQQHQLVRSRSGKSGSMHPPHLLRCNT